MQTNCLTEIFIEEALERASQLDAFLRENGRVVGPLHGLPISLKDQFCVRGHEASMGTPHKHSDALIPMSDHRIRFMVGYTRKGGFRRSRIASPEWRDILRED